MSANDISTLAAKPQVEIYTDGGCEPNPGPGGCGVVLLHPKKRAEASGGFRLTNNNRMEIQAAIKGLEMLKQPCQVTLFSDSQYLVDAIMKGWVAKWKMKGWWLNTKTRAKNIDLWEKLLPLCETHQVEFQWVKGHAGNQENERCDQLSDAALRQPNLPADEGYEHKPQAEGVRPAMQAGDPCRKCSTPVTKQTPRKKHSRDFYYEFYLLCPKCKTMYMVEEAKRLVEQSPSLI
jgi:ribonuclease HI